MKYMTSRSIAIIFLVLCTKSLIEGIDINNYFQLINDVQRYYLTSCVIFVRSDKYDMNMMALIHTWSRKLSDQRVMTVTRTFSNLTKEYNWYMKNATRPLFVVLLDTEETMSEFSVTTKTIKPMSFPFWLVIFLQRPENPLEKYCKHPIDNVFNVDFGTEMLVLCYDRPNLVEWYATCDNHVRTFDLATWSPDKGLILRTLENVYARRSDMFGDVMRVASVTISPLLSYENDMLGGFFGALLTELSKMMNFTVKLLDPLEEFGALKQNRKGWTGVIGQLIADEADLGVAAFSRTTHRETVVDFTTSLARSKYHLYFRQPEEVKWALYFRAFSFEVWISLIMLIIVATFMLTIMKSKEFSTNLIFENYIKVWGIYCQQSWPVPKETPMRLAFLSIYVSSILTLCMYSASVISHLTNSTPDLLFSSLEDFVEDGSYKFLVMSNSAEYELPTRITDPTFIKLYTLMDHREYLPKTLLEGFKQICERKNVAFYTTELNRMSVQNNMQCTIGHINSGRTDNLGLILAKGSPYTRFINYHLRRFKLKGVMSKLKSEYIPTDVPQREIIYDNVDFFKITPILTIVMCSMMVALFILIIEKVYYSFKTRYKNNFDSKNKLQNRNSDRILKEFYYNRPFGYWP